MGLTWRRWERLSLLLENLLGGKPKYGFCALANSGFYKYYVATGSSEAVNCLHDERFYGGNFSEKDGCEQFDMDSGIVMAVYVEGVNKAYALADELGDEARKNVMASLFGKG